MLQWVKKNEEATSLALTEISGPLPLGAWTKTHAPSGADNRMPIPHTDTFWT